MEERGHRLRARVHQILTDVTDTANRLAARPGLTEKLADDLEPLDRARRELIELAEALGETDLWHFRVGLPGEDQMPPERARAILAAEEILDQLEDEGTVTFTARQPAEVYGHQFAAGESVTVAPHDPEVVAVARVFDRAMDQGGPWSGIRSEFLERFGYPMTLGENAADFWQRVY